MGISDASLNLNLQRTISFEGGPLIPMSAEVVKKAIFPVAGLGTRFLPATKAVAKEMLPIVDRPLIQYAIDEAAAAGIEHIIFIAHRSKRSIEDHVHRAVELENELVSQGTGVQRNLDLCR